MAVPGSKVKPYTYGGLDRDILPMGKRQSNQGRGQQGEKKDDGSALMGRIQAGEPRAQRELVEQYRDQLIGFVRLRVKSDNIEPIVYETFYRAIRYSRSFQFRSKLSTWLCAIAKNLCKTHHKRKFISRDAIDRIDEIVESGAWLTEAVMQAYKNYEHGENHYDPSMQLESLDESDAEDLEDTCDTITEVYSIPVGEKLSLEDDESGERSDQLGNDDNERSKERESPVTDVARPARGPEKKLLERINKLPPEYRAVIRLWIKGRCHKEIAETLGITEGNSKVRLHRAREVLARWGLPQTVQSISRPLFYDSKNHIKHTRKQRVSYKGWALKKGENSPVKIIMENGETYDQPKEIAPRSYKRHWKKMKSKSKKTVTKGEKSWSNTHEHGAKAPAIG